MGGRRRRAAGSGSRGQATIETVAMLPLLVLVALVLAQVLAAHSAAALASGAAEAGAVALLQDRDAAAAARSALGDVPSRRADVHVSGRRVEVRVRPRVVIPPLADALATTAAADAGPAAP